MQVSGSFSAQPSNHVQAASLSRAATETASIPQDEPQIEITDQSSLSCQQREAHFLIHPGTALEFREVLEPLLELVPQHALEAVAAQGYVIHVVDDCGLHPLTIDLEWIDPAAFGRAKQSDCRAIDLDQEARLEELIHQHFCESLSETENWAEPFLQLNPDLAHGSETIPKGKRIYFPPFREYFGRLVRCGSKESAYEFLTLPRTSYVAGMVLNAPIDGFLGPERKVVLWDCLFRGDSRLRSWYIFHELGHCLDYSWAFANPRQWKEWRRRLTENWNEQLSLGCVTRYCKESVEEYLAESVAAWLTQACYRGETSDLGDLAQQRLLLDRSQIENRDPDVCCLIEELLASL